jgi:hypothetical protein
MKFIVLFLLIGCASVEKINPKVYVLDHTGLYRQQDNEFIPIQSNNIQDFFCLTDKDLIEILERINK